MLQRYIYRNDSDPIFYRNWHDILSHVGIATAAIRKSSGIAHCIFS